MRSIEDVGVTNKGPPEGTVTAGAAPAGAAPAGTASAGAVPDGGVRDLVEEVCEDLEVFEDPAKVAEDGTDTLSGVEDMEPAGELLNVTVDGCDVEGIVEDTGRWPAP